MLEFYLFGEDNLEMSQAHLVKDVNRAGITPHRNVATRHIKAGVLKIDITNIYFSNSVTEIRVQHKDSLLLFYITIKTSNMKFSFPYLI